MKYKIWWIVSGVLAVFFLLPSSAGLSKTPEPEGSFTMAVEMDVSILDPHHRAGWTSIGVWANFFQALAVPSGVDWHSIPNLAESWEIIDPQTWKFTLQRGVKFQNGQPLTSADVKFSFDRILGKINRKYPGFAKSIYKRLVDRIETPDDHTVIIHTKYPEASFIALISGIFIAPKTYVVAVGDKEFAKKPIGTGPFKFKSRKIGESIHIEAYENFWNTNPQPGAIGPSKVKNVIYKIIPEMQTRVAALRAGEIDGLPIVSVDSAKALAKDPHIRLYYTAINQPQYIMFNWRAEKDPRTGEPNPLRDVRVRHALSYALDLDAIIKNYLTGREYRTTMLGKDSIGYDPHVPFYDYNPEKAKALLKEAGYPHGFAMPFHVTGDVRPHIQAIAQYWREIGVNVKFKKTTTPVVIRAVLRKTFYGFVSWHSGRGPDTVKGLGTQLKSSGMWAMHGGDERMDRLVDTQQRELDRGKRVKVIHEIVQILWKDAWYVPLWEPVAIKAIRTEWHYESMPAAPGIILTNLSKKR